MTTISPSLETDKNDEYPIIIYELAPFLTIIFPTLVIVYNKMLKVFGKTVEKRDS